MTATAVVPVNISQEMRDAYLDYAMSVIVARALPDARDGLKPVHRRILYAMYDMGLRADTPFKKCARIVGEVLGKYHPHGDSAVYESLVRLAQEFSMRYPLIAGQGNFGSIDGDGAAAMRYTEARLTQMGEELLVDLNMDTVDFGENFDGTLTEPLVLPASIPSLLVNGASGIAVGMSTNIPPHNMGEVCDALQHMLAHWEQLEDVTVEDLMQHIKGPDFPTGGLVYRHVDGAEDGDDSLVGAYATGRGKITMRAKVHFEDMGRGKSRIIISELPYQTNKSTLVERIASLVRDGRLEGITDLRDESDRQGMRLTIELGRAVDPASVMERLFKLTPLQDTFSIIMLALVGGEPRLLSLKQALKVYLDHRIIVVRRRSAFDLRRARDRAHILDGLLKALDQLDAVIDTIRRSRSADTARTNLMRLLSISDIQAQAILDMQLRRIAALERKKIDDEYAERMKLIAYLESLLASEIKLREVIGEEVRTVKDAYGDPRRTIITDATASGTVTIESLMLPQETSWVSLSAEGRIGRTLGETSPTISDTTDAPRFLVQSDSMHTIYLFADNGTCVTIPTHQLPQTEIVGGGAPFADVSMFKNGEIIVGLLSLAGSVESGILCFATAMGEVKRLQVADLPGMMSNIFKVMDIDSGDRIGWTLPTSGEDEIILVTRAGQAIRFKETDVRTTTMGTGGMRGVRLVDESDRVISALVARPDTQLITMTASGVAKSSPLSEYPTQGRAGAGVVTMKLSGAAERLAAAALSTPEERLLVLTDHARAVPLRVGLVPSGRRDKRGDIVVTLGEGEQVSSLLHVPLG
ncbi:MAG: DNA topoisomerase (ATP-hydrolyzing) [Chloroflexota bacterium]|nr:DNA topoisomerase (ATP-hydrolyzing) [Chloroflexota bacterium]